MTAPLKADQQAAERLLKAAVRRAVEVLRAHPIDHREPVAFGGRVETIITYRYSNDGLAQAQRLLCAAGESAALLLGEAS